MGRRGGGHLLELRQRHWGTVITKLAGAEVAAEWSAALTAPIVEEIYKVLGVVLIALIARAETDDLMDGFVYGAMVGLGFTVTEDIDYFLSAFGGSIGGVLAGFWVRVVASGLYGHVLYTGLAGIGVAYFVRHRTDQPRVRRTLVAVGLLSLAMGAHLFWNSPLIWEVFPLFVATAIKGLPFLLVLVLVLRLARRREHRWLAAALEQEVGRPGLLAEEIDPLSEPRRRRAASKRVRKAAGRDAQELLKRVHREQIDLAMIATRAASLRTPISSDSGRASRSCAASCGPSPAHRCPGDAEISDRGGTRDASRASLDTG